MKKIYLAILLLWATECVYADSWHFEPEIVEKAENHGDTKIVLKRDSTKNTAWPVFELSIYNKEELLSRFRNIGFQDLFVSDDEKYFVGLSNSGIPGTAYVIFDSRGYLIKEVKHDYFPEKYSSRSITVSRKWYNPETVSPEFVYEEWGLEKILVTTDVGCRINLLELEFYIEESVEIDWKD